MKQKIFTVSLIMLVLIIYLVIVTSFTNIKEDKEIASNPPAAVRDTFTNCIFNASFREINNWGISDEVHVAKITEKYNELGFNAVHSYDEGVGSEVYGRSDVPVLSSQQINNYKGFLDSVKTCGNLYGFFERSFISKYCYGQRLIYEVSETNGNTTDNYGFVYRTRNIGSYEQDGERNVVHAKPKPSDQSQGYLAKKIYENLQHSDLFNFRQNDQGTWYIKPVMRIPTGIPDGVPVVKIEIVAFDSTVVKTININSENFKDNGVYYGDYLEKYFDLPQNQKLEITGKNEPGGLNQGRSEDLWWQWDNLCKVDFRVWWYGQCEVWFDKMLVDDEIGNELFNVNNQNDYINPRLEQEVSNFTNYGSLYSFFTDEVFMSQYQCIKYVVEKLRQYNPHARLSLAFTRNAEMRGLKNDLVGYEVFLKEIKPDYLQDDHHGFQSYLQKIPPTINITDTKIPSDWIASSNEEYNIQLQTNTLGSSSDPPLINSPGSLLSELIFVKNNVRHFLPSAKFIMQPQLHGWIFADTVSGFYLKGSREPTNEEIQVQAMLSVAYGSDGLCWFVYNSRIDSTYYTNKPGFYTIGLVNPIDGTTKREINCYGQNKWNYISQMNRKILNWKETIETTKWIEGYSVHKDGANHRYISDILSRVPHLTGTNPCIRPDNNYYDCPEERYWEMAFFQPMDINDKSKYLLMVNRRCIPQTQSYAGDNRILYIKFNQNELQGFTNWKIKDVSTGDEIVFTKNNTDYINLGESTSSLGYFKPGEGKLYKISPVM